MRQGIIGIAGGMGPMAGIALHEKIVRNTLSDGADQDHLDVIHVSQAARITDRSLYLLSLSGESRGHVVNPALGLVSALDAFEAIGRVELCSVVVGIPCSTFHALEIFQCLDAEAKRLPHVRLLHMVNETIAELKAMPILPKRVGVLMTNGARIARVYTEALEHLGVEVVELSDQQQQQLHASIYSREYGLKAQIPASQRARDVVSTCAEILWDGGADLVILGCTELPFAFDAKAETVQPVLDPLDILARSLIRSVAADRLVPILNC